MGKLGGESEHVMLTLKLNKKKQTKKINGKCYFSEIETKNIWYYNLQYTANAVIYRA